MIQVFLLVILGWPASHYERPVLFAAIYGVLIWVLGMVAGPSLGAAALMTAISLVIALVYYKLLARFSDSLGIWLAILISVPILIVMVNIALLPGRATGTT